MHFLSFLFLINSRLPFSSHTFNLFDDLSYNPAIKHGGTKGEFMKNLFFTLVICIILVSTSCTNEKPVDTIVNVDHRILKKYEK